jgi:hypothetical protein
VRLLHCMTACLAASSCEARDCQFLLNAVAGCVAMAVFTSPCQHELACCLLLEDSALVPAAVAALLPASASGGLLSLLCPTAE